MNGFLLKRAGTVCALATVAVLALAGPASAHVTVNPNTATQGGYTKVTFRVPNESDTASTTKVEVNLPANAPVASVSLKAVPGWTAVAVKSKLATPIKAHDAEITEAVTKITWTAAAGSETKPGYFQEFDVSLGPLLKLAAATGDEHGASAALSSPAATDSKDSDDSRSGSGTWLGLAGLVAGLAGLVAGLLAYRRGGTQPSCHPAGAGSASARRECRVDLGPARCGHDEPLTGGRLNGRPPARRSATTGLAADRPISRAMWTTTASLLPARHRHPVADVHDARHAPGQEARRGACLARGQLAEEKDDAVLHLYL